MLTKATAFCFAIALAILAAAAPACLNRALPGGGTLQGSTAGASGVVSSGAGGGGGAVTSGTGAGGGGGAMTTGNGTGGGGGSAIGCPHLACPQIFSPWSRALDERGCETCACAPGPGPGDCEDIICGPRPDASDELPGRGDRRAPRTGTNASGSDRECKLLPPCPAAECGPITRSSARDCHDGKRCRRPSARVMSDMTCRWHYSDCPPSCVALATRERCDKVAGCQWLIRACGEPTIPATGCVDKDDISVAAACAPRRENARASWWIPARCRTTSPAGATCDDAVCRDVGIAVCAWW